eukprot:m.215305 g.215305  ORF g.215305 m.215305 type:complete len:51 (-) comp19091_c0_seq2:145-297(-)
MAGHFSIRVVSLLRRLSFSRAKISTSAAAVPPSASGSQDGLCNVLNMLHG